MLAKPDNHRYRTEIDGLRAIAVLGVIAFHYGFIANGYLGVDVFFVISGFLITGIIKRELDEGRFSIVNFYLRRTRRILPLAIFVPAVALLVGMKIMLPHDLRSLAENVVATNFFANNVLQVVAINNYWDVWNNYKPLMHTWSLGVEEQYYFFYPLLFLLIGKKRASWIVPAVSAFAAISLVMCFLPQFDDTHKFYIITFRFWELAVGGLAAIVMKDRLIKHKLSWILALALIVIQCLPWVSPMPVIPLLVTTALTATLLISDPSSDKIALGILGNPFSIWIGKISFSLYMWHQVVLAFWRYALVQVLGPLDYALIFAITIALSAFTYAFVEQPFRDKKRVSTKTLFAWLIPAFVCTSAVGLWVFKKHGVLRDVPEMNIYKSAPLAPNAEEYNARIYDMDKDFTSTNKVKVLVAGNSFARDWANVLLESRFKDQIEVSYIYEPEKSKTVADRSTKADVVFCSFAPRSEVQAYIPEMKKVWIVGVKSFGMSNGVFFNHRGPGYFEQRTAMEPGTYEQNARLKAEWGDRYIDLASKVLDGNKTVPVFTPEHKFISQDGRHLTQPGAQFFAGLEDAELARILGPLMKAR